MDASGTWKTQSKKDLHMTVETITKLPQDLFAETCQQIMKYLQCQTPGINILELNHRIQTAGVELNVEDVEKIVKFITYLFRTAAKSDLSAEELTTRLANSSNKWSKEAVQVIRHMWHEKNKPVTDSEDAKNMRPAGQLVDFHWKLGMAVSSDSCRTLNYPYVSITLEVADSSGQITYKSFEMTVPQFQNFFRQFKEMAAVLETV
ncbi:COMM domain-containing protein 6 isoform X2 [Latimeria chalumnae]|uniref:COMM domain-containing protein 6 isoform X2 n=1 Tax=Latimeria chalumnae TaxID=7897 RepID=UPI00313E56A8